VAPSRRILAIAALVSLTACSGRAAPAGVPAPASPEAAVAAFLAAVDSNDIGRMAALWGTDRGPSTVVVRNTLERERRLVVMQRLLIHDAFRFVPLTGPTTAPPGRRLLNVELTRDDRRAAVPFTAVAQRAGGWLVEAIGLDSAMTLANPRTRTTP